MSIHGWGKCDDCEKMYIKSYPAQVRCPDCQKAYNLKRQKERYRQLREQRRKDPNECGRKGSCKYAGYAGAVQICDYMCKTGHKRPCPVKGCTEYKRKTKPKRDSCDREEHKD